MVTQWLRRPSCGGVSPSYFNVIEQKTEMV